jgi:hypothetical protein
LGFEGETYVVDDLNGVQESFRMEIEFQEGSGSFCGSTKVSCKSTDSSFDFLAIILSVESPISSIVALKPPSLLQFSPHTTPHPTLPRKNKESRRFSSPSRHSFSSRENQLDVCALRAENDIDM